MADLSFRALRAANTARLPQFKNRHGLPAHGKADGSDWSVNDWFVATMGELGEAANVAKKLRRGDFTAEEARPKLRQELADVVIYLDILAKRLGIDLAEAVRDTFNAKSAEVGSTVRIGEADGAAFLFGCDAPAPTMFWPVDDTEYSRASIDEAMEDADPLEWVEIQQAVALPNIFAVRMPYEDEDAIATFATRAEADAAIAAHVAAAEAQDAAAKDDEA